MNHKPLTLAALAAPLLLAVGVAVAAVGSTALTPTRTSSACTLTAPNASAATSVTIDNLDATQISYAHIIYTVGTQQLGLPQRAPIIAIATAMQESGLHNLTHDNQDSLGLFAQRPSQGWGTPQQVLDPVYAATAFYQHLIRVPDWQTRPLTDVAQAVQRSGFPLAYAKWETLATDLAATFGDAAGTCTADTGITIPGDIPTALPNGFALPAGTPSQVITAAAWAIAQLGTSYRFGGTCTDPHGPDLNTHCDCSSLVQQAYKAAGISIPRVTTDQVHAGTPVPGASLLQAGDLIFLPGSLGSRANPRHVGMYLGNGMIINAPHTGDVVKIVKLQGYWLSNMVAIRRIVQFL